MSDMMTPLIFITTTLASVVIGYKMGKKQNDNRNVDHILLCGHIDTTEIKLDDDDNDWPVIDVDTCNESATTIIGGKSLCNEHFEEYLESMISVTAE